MTWYGFLGLTVVTLFAFAGLVIAAAWLQNFLDQNARRRP